MKNKDKNKNEKKSLSTGKKLLIILVFSIATIFLEYF